MENKVSLYSSNNVKIGETFLRRAKQLVKQQRAMWTDDTQTAVRFAPGKENTYTTTDSNDSIDASADDFIRENQLCFARWKDGRYYPGVIGEVTHSHAKVVFLDGHSSLVIKGHIVELQEALKTMDFEGKWRNGIIYFKGALLSQQPMIMHYDDGDVEQVELRQLRGTKRAEGWHY